MIQPAANQFTGGMSTALPFNMGLHVDYVYNHAKGDYKTLNINFRDPVTLLRPLPQFSRIDQVRPDADLKYKALYVKAEKRYSHNSQFLVSYTFTDSDDNNPMGRYLDVFDLSLDYGPSGGERRHAIVASGSVLLPWDITIGALYTYRTQLPWSATAGRDLNGDSFNTDLVPGTTRNSGSRDLNLTAVNAYRAAQRPGGDQRSGHRQLAHQHHGHAREQGAAVRRAPEDRAAGAGVQPASTRRTCRRSSAAAASATRSRTRSAGSPARGRRDRSSWPSRRRGRCGV